MFPWVRPNIDRMRWVEVSPKVCRILPLNQFAPVGNDTPYAQTHTVIAQDAVLTSKKAFFRKIGRREIDRDSALWPVELRVQQR